MVVGSSRFCIFIKLNEFPVEGVLFKKDLKMNEVEKILFSNYNKNGRNESGLSIGHSIRVKVASVVPFNGSINFSV